MSNFIKPENIAFKTFVLPADLNFHGTLFGGAMMAYLDQAGAIIAQGRSKSRVFLVSMNSAQFKSPAYMNDCIIIYGDVKEVGNTSLVVSLEAWREDPISGERAISATAEATYVAIDENLKPWPVDR